MVVKTTVFFFKYLIDSVCTFDMCVYLCYSLTDVTIIINCWSVLGLKKFDPNHWTISLSFVLKVCLHIDRLVNKRESNKIDISIHSWQQDEKESKQFATIWLQMLILKFVNNRRAWTTVVDSLDACVDYSHELFIILNLYYLVCECTNWQFLKVKQTCKLSFLGCFSILCLECSLVNLFRALHLDTNISHP